MTKILSRITKLEAKLAAETGPRGGKIIGKTQSGKPIYESHGNRNHKNFTKKDHLDAARAHQALHAQAADLYHKQHNGDGTYSKQHAKNKERLKKVMEHHHLHSHKHINSAEGNKPSPDQRDFDRMDRKNDPHHRSKSWGTTASTGPRGGKIIGKTRSGKPIYDSADHPAHQGFSKEDHKDAAQLHHDIIHAPQPPHIQKYYGNGVRKLENEGMTTSDAQGAMDAKHMIEGKKHRDKSAGETGPRGGKIIGKTRSGKPIYETSNHPAHKDYSPEDHVDAMKAHSKAIHNIRENHGLNAPGKEGVRVKGPDSMSEAFHSVQWNNHDKASGWLGTKSKSAASGKSYFDWAGDIYEFSNDKLREMANKALKNWANPNLGVNFKDYGHVVPKAPSGAEVHDFITNFSKKKFWEQLAKTASKENIKYNDKQFGKLLQPGDKVEIENKYTGKKVREVIDRFDGLEYHFKGKPDAHDRMGHSGFSVDSPKQFTIYMNREPHLVVTKVAKVAYYEDSGAYWSFNNMTLEKILDKKWHSVPAIREAMKEIGAKEKPDHGDWMALFALPHGYFGVRKHSDHFTVEEA